MKALECVRLLGLPDCYIAAGFLRNLVWDHQHDKPNATPLNDVDVIYFDKKEPQPARYLHYEQLLKAMLPQVQWQVRNQARMHVRNGDAPYHSSLDAMRYWPEKETAVAVRLLDDGSLDYLAAFDFNSLFAGKVTHNPRRDYAIFVQRVNTKGWLNQWPKLRLFSLR
ncbi:hypothetical protein VA7868_04587 [Vibrio aerogenes CECT 7868]|uniref:Nitrate reductase n=2 Tax=Vibrio aerogenes TaxID=92172 RepID=A0A1M6F6I9_9VIBR|nr:hypothetical protein VA7868_04587 [Vibrio aerogenes CECT 7868]